jgi:hypothetical protein
MKPRLVYRACDMYVTAAYCESFARSPSTRGHVERPPFLFLRRARNGYTRAMAE